MNTATRDKFSANYSARTPKEAIALILTKGKAVINAKNNLPPTLGALEAMYLPYTMDFEDRTWTIRLKDSMVRIEPDRAVEKPVVKVAEKEEAETTPPVPAKAEKKVKGGQQVTAETISALSEE